MNRNVKIGLIIVVVIILLVGFWKMTAPKKIIDDKKMPPIPQPQGSGTGTIPPIEVAEDGTTGLDADLIATTGTEDSDDSAVFSGENLISDEPA